MAQPDTALQTFFNAVQQSVSHTSREAATAGAGEASTSTAAPRMPNQSTGSLSLGAIRAIRRNLSSLDQHGSSRTGQQTSTSTAADSSAATGAVAGVAGQQHSSNNSAQTGTDIESGEGPPLGSSQPPGEGGEESTAAAAERHRLTADTAIDLQSLVVWLDSLLPYLLLCLAVFLAHYALVLLQLLWLMGCLHKLNLVLRKAWLQRDSNVQQVAPTVLYVGVSVWACLYVTSSWWLLSCLLFHMPEATTTTASVFSVCLCVALLDCVARVLVVGVLQLPVLLAARLHKRLRLPPWQQGIPITTAGVAGSSGSTVAGNSGSNASSSSSSSSGGAGSSGPAVERARNRRLAALLSLLDVAAAMYRQLLPVPLWYNYLVYRCTANAIVASCLAGGYVTCKVVELRSAWDKLRAAARGAVEAQQGFGRPASSQEVQAAGNQCPICQDGVKHGLRLTCGHVFCEECVTEWLERDVTCPMCRQQVKEPDSSKGLTAAALLPRLF